MKFYSIHESRVTCIRLHVLARREGGCTTVRAHASMYSPVASRPHCRGSLWDSVKRRRSRYSSAVARWQPPLPRARPTSCVSAPGSVWLLSESAPKAATKA